MIEYFSLRAYAGKATDMFTQKYEKEIFICRIVVVISALLLFALFGLLAISAFADMLLAHSLAGNLFKGVVVIAFAGTFLPQFLIFGYKFKMKKQKPENSAEKQVREAERPAKK